MKKKIALVVLLIATISACCVLTMACSDDTPQDSKYIEVTYYEAADGEPYYVFIEPKTAGDWSGFSPVTKPGYDFLGYFDAPEGGVQIINSEGWMVNGVSNNFTMWAQFEPATYTRTFGVPEHGYLADGQSIDVKIGTNITELPVPLIENGYKFVGWKCGDTLITDGNGAVIGTYTSVTDANIAVWLAGDKIEAVIEELKFVVKLESDGEVVKTYEYNYGEALPDYSPMSNDPDNMTDFIGWSVNPFNYVDYREQLACQSITEDITLFAIWKKYREIKFSFRFTDDPYYSYDDMYEKVYEGESISAPQYDIPGYYLYGWYPTQLMNTSQVKTIGYTTSYDTYYGDYRLATYTVTYADNDGETFSPFNYTKKDTITLETAHEKDNYTFIGWCRNEDLSDTPMTEISVGTYGDMTLYACYLGDEKKVIYNPMEGEIEATYKIVNYDSKFVLDVPEYDGYAFDGWYSDEWLSNRLTDRYGVSVKPYPYLDDEVVVYAKYVAKRYLYVNTTNGVEVDTEDYYVQGDVVTLVVTVADGYRYDGIYDENGELLSSARSYTLTIGADDISLQIKASRKYKLSYVWNDTAKDYTQYFQLPDYAYEGDKVVLEFDISASSMGVSSATINGVAFDEDALEFVMPGNDSTVVINMGPKKATVFFAPSLGLKVYKYREHYYSLIKLPSSCNWQYAKEYCEFLGGYLTAVNSGDENWFLSQLLISNNVTDTVFLGGYDEGREGNWAWINTENAIVSYFNWHSGEPSGGTSENYMCFYTDFIKSGNYQWCDISGSYKTRYFICEWSGVTFIPTYAGMEVTDFYGDEIELETFKYNGHYYAIFNKSMTWVEAEKYCEYIGGHLATITSAEENDRLFKWASLAGVGSSYFWLGASDVEEEGVWKWVTGEAWGYTNWGSGQPDNGSSKENYLSSWNNNTWNDAYGNKDYFICEWDSKDDIGNIRYGNYFNKISTADQLKAIGENSEDKTYWLESYISLKNKTWTPVADFKGTIIGNGHTIRYLTLDSSEGDIAMFLTLSGTVSDINFENVSVSSTSASSSNVGVLAVTLTGTISNINIKSGSVTSEATGRVGGLVASVVGGTITDCSNKATVTHSDAGSTDGGKGCSTGGIAGQMTSGAITGCTNSGSISSKYSTGGIVGLYTGGTLTSCTNTGAVTGEEQGAGGIVGTGSFSGNLTLTGASLENKGTVAGKNNVGGVFGEFVQSVDSSYSYKLEISGFVNSGEIKGTSCVGGIIGKVYCNNSSYNRNTTFVATLCENTGDVTADDVNVGGIIGYGYADASDSIVKNVTSFATIKGLARVGGIAGTLSGIALEDSSNLGCDIIATGYEYSGSNRYAYLGGYVGYGSSISKLNNASDISYDYDGYYVGGIAGYIYGTVTSCTNTGTVTAESAAYVGGVAGYVALGAATYTFAADTNTGAVSGKEYVGGIFGQLYSSLDSGYNYEITLNKFSNSGEVTATGSYVGGIIGYLYCNNAYYNKNTTVYINNCTDTGSTVSGKSYVGGIIGYGYSDSSSSVITGATVSSDVSAEFRVGGVAGHLDNIQIAKSDNTDSTVYASSYEIIEGKYYAYIGGYVGYGAAVSECTNNVKISYSGRGDYVGGIAGYANYLITDCVNNASVEAYSASHVGGIAGADNFVGTYTGNSNKNTGKINGKEYVGGIFGQLYSSLDSGSNYEITLNKFSNSGEVTATGSYAGGIIGYLYCNNAYYNKNTTVLINDCTNTGNITGTNNVGGIIGYGYSDTTASQIKGASASATVTASYKVGAIAGVLDNIQLISCSNANSEVKADGQTTETDSTVCAYVGGFVGKSYSVSGCENKCTVNYTGSGRYVGGVAGYATGNITDSKNTVNINAQNADCVGGIAGYVSVSGNLAITECSNGGNIYGGSYVGGIVGQMYGSVNSNGNYTITINTVSNSGEIRSLNYAGTHVGGLFGWINCNNSYSGKNFVVTATNLRSEDTTKLWGAAPIGLLIGAFYTDGNSTLMGYYAGGDLFPDDSSAEYIGDENGVGKIGNLTISQ